MPMLKRFSEYTKRAIANYKSRCERLEKGIEISTRSGDMESARKYKKMLFKQRATLCALFAFLFCCLLIIIFG